MAWLEPLPIAVSVFPVDGDLPTLVDAADPACVGALLAGAIPRAAEAQTWPTRPVTLVVPYGPGASNDIFTRAIAAILGKQLGQPFVVENRPGAGGFTGTKAVTLRSRMFHGLKRLARSLGAPPETQDGEQ